jgi:hypothetical protein
LYILENKINLLQEEKNFISKEIKNAKQYNNYLKSKLKDLEEANIIETKTKNEPSLDGTSRIKSSRSPRNKEKEVEKLDFFFKRNEEILKQKILKEEKQIKEKYSKFKVIESFKNPVLLILHSKVKDYEFNLMNSKVSNQEVFFNIPENDLSSSKTKRV